MKIVINACCGGFGLSEAAFDAFRKAAPDHPGDHAWEIPRDHPALVAVVEQMGDAADGWCAELKVVEIPDGVEWKIEEYDGRESIHEKHRSWA